VRLPFFYGWVVVASAFVTMGIGVNARTAFSLLFPPILDEFGWERGLTAGAFAVGFAVSTPFSPWLGWLMDRRGVRALMLLGVVMMGSGLALAPFITRPWHLYLTLGFLVSGGSLCLGYTGHALFLPHWFVRRRGLAMGIAFSGVGVGSIVLLPWAQHLISSRGWRAACVGLAVVMFAVLIPINAIFPRRRPEDMGLLPDGARAQPAGTPAVRPANIVDPRWAATDWTLARATRTARFWWVFIGFFTGLFAWYAIQVHQTRYLIDIGFRPEPAAYALGLVALAGVVGQIVMGHLSDRFGREPIWTLGCAGFVACFLLLLAMRASPTSTLLWAMVLSQGVLGYGMASVFAAIPAELFQGRHYGSVFGTLSLAIGFGSGAGPWVTGWLHDRTGDYVLAFEVGIGASVLSAVAIWLAAPRKVRLVAGRVPRAVAAAGKSSDA
jgi:MFS family permease